MTAKERLSLHIETIFKKYMTPGLHICDIATGGGKSYSIGKLTCEYYPKHFDRIIILCVQNKLTLGMQREINRFVDNSGSLILPSDVLVIENNSEVVTKAIKNKTLKSLLDEIQRQLAVEQNRGGSKYLKTLQQTYEHLARINKRLDTLLQPWIQDDAPNVPADYIQQIVEDDESKLRYYSRQFFEAYRKHLEYTKQCKKVKLETILSRFPSFKKVFPQVEYKSKKVLLMTVHKAMYGIDPIWDEKVQLSELAEKKKNKRTLLIFDESDQAAVAIRNTIIDQVVQGSVGSKRFNKGYNTLLQYRKMIVSTDNLDDSYYGEILEQSVAKARKIVETKWQKVFGDVDVYNSIFLDENEDMENYRRGVFFSGVNRLTISASNQKDQKSYICHKKGKKSFTLVHATNIDELKQSYEKVVAIDDFLTLVVGSLNAIKAQLNFVIRKAYEKSKEKFDADIKTIQENRESRGHYIGYPTIEREIHTLLSRFEVSAEYIFETQLLDYMTTRKNISLLDGDKFMNFPDYSVYTQGVQLFQEEVDDKDNQQRVRLTCREINNTPEKVIVDLLSSSAEPTTSIVLCSATAANQSVVSNYDIAYLRQRLGDKVYALSDDEWQTFDKLVEQTYPEGHQVNVIPVAKYEYEDKRENKLSLPDKYRKMFSQSAQEEGLADKWFDSTLRMLKHEDNGSVDEIVFKLYRLFQFIEAYHWFYTHGDIHSMIFFQNRTGDKDKEQYHVLSRLIDGTYKDESESFVRQFPMSWNNSTLRITKDWEDVENNVLSELSANKDAKIMLVSAYNSFKAGANMQYTIPQELDYISGDIWDTDEQKKDWDAVFLQSPTAYLMMSEDGNEYTFEKNLHHAMLTLMMLFERGCLSKENVRLWLHQALSGTFYFGDKNNPGVAHDKAAWAQTIIEQAIGRLCRTRNKPHTTYVLYDQSMSQYFDSANMHKSLTKEFRALASYIAEHPIESLIEINPDEVVRCNNANYAKEQLNTVRRKALFYTPHPSDDIDSEIDDIEEDTISYSVKVAQHMNQSYKHTIISKPVIDSLDELIGEDSKLTFISRCYGDWPMEGSGGYVFHYDSSKNRLCCAGKGNSYTITPSKTRLDTLMKNSVIKKYFEKQGYATEWKQGKYILHPDILATDYTGEIGEEAFKALLLHYTSILSDEIKHLEDKEYEYADFIVQKADGRRIAFDVKNMNPNVEHDDQEGDLPTAEKRRRKEEKLGCPIITVNMLRLERPSLNATKEISGMIDENGMILPEAIDTLTKLLAPIV